MASEACNCAMRARIVPMTPTPMKDISAVRRLKITLASRLGSVEPIFFGRAISTQPRLRPQRRARAHIEGPHEREERRGYDGCFGIRFDGNVVAQPQRRQ